MTSLQIVKAGNLHRKSKILRRWKVNWFVLYSNGDLKYFESEHSFEPEETIFIPVECKHIRTNQACRSDPPEHLTKDCLISLDDADGDVLLTLCAESPDDAMAWSYMLDQARVHQASPHVLPSRGHSAPPPYQFQHPPPYSPMINGSTGQYVMPQQVIYHPNGTQTVIIGENGTPYHYCHECHGYCHDRGSHLGGLALGLAAGSLLFYPFMWAPFF